MRVGNESVLTFFITIANLKMILITSYWEDKDNENFDLCVTWMIATLDAQFLARMVFWMTGNLEEWYFE